MRVHSHVDECAQVCHSEELPERTAVVEEGGEDGHEDDVSEGHRHHRYRPHR